ncbi:MAG: hypothetical protein HY053_04265 [Proteobacteria bacterium]|nr:hypothetical protein [Pseudomonadota bacterium]
MTATARALTQEQMLGAIGRTYEEGSVTARAISGDLVEGSRAIMNAGEAVGAYQTPALRPHVDLVADAKVLPARQPQHDRGAPKMV